MVTDRPFVCATITVHEIRNQHLPLVRQSKRPEIKQLVMQNAKTESVVDGIRSAGLMLLDVRRLQSN